MPSNFKSIGFIIFLLIFIVCLVSVLMLINESKPTIGNHKYKRGELVHSVINPNLKFMIIDTLRDELGRPTYIGGTDQVTKTFDEIEVTK